MPPSPSPLQQVLRALVLRLVLLLDGMMGLRAAYLRARLRALPDHHKRRRALEAELAHIDRARAILADPESYEDPRFRGLVAEVARVRNDPGRRALPRRRIHPNPFFALPNSRPAPAAEQEAPEGRCTPITA